jgi:hypothetical protein
MRIGTRNGVIAVVVIGLCLLGTAGIAPGQQAGAAAPVAAAPTPGAAALWIHVSSGASEPLQPAVYLPYSTDQNTSMAPPPTGTSRLLPDGSFLSHRTGRFARSSDGSSWEFTLDANPALAGAQDAVSSSGPVSLTVLPNRQLSAMENSVSQPSEPDSTGSASSTAPSAGEAKLNVTGLITRYKNQNFLLVDSTEVPNADAAVLAAEKVEPGGGGNGGNPPSTQPIAPLPADKMLDQMLKSSGNTSRPLRPTTGPAHDRTSGASAVAPGAALLQVMREGTFLVDRTGRLTRGGDGQSWEFSFDSDGRTMKDAPVVILPNLKLMAMEQAAKSSNRDLRFRVTGMVTEYNGRNYVLLEKVVVVPEVTQQF